MIVKVLNNQRLVDLCMQVYGDQSFLFDAALAVGKSITDELLGVTELDFPVLETTGEGKSVAQVLSKLLNLPASADDDGINFFLPPGGIGYMKIKAAGATPVENDFIVS